MTILVDDEVWAEVFAAASRYERERASLGDEFVEAVDADDPPIRRYVMPRFPS